MRTQKQIAASRENGRKSHGASTPEGKARILYALSVGIPIPDIAAAEGCSTRWVYLVRRNAMKEQVA